MLKHSETYKINAFWIGLCTKIGVLGTVPKKNNILWVPIHCKKSLILYVLLNVFSISIFLYLFIFLYAYTVSLKRMLVFGCCHEFQWLSANVLMSQSCMYLLHTRTNVCNCCMCCRNLGMHHSLIYV